MEYPYLQEGEGNHPTPETTEAHHHQDQYLAHSQHQQYPLAPQATQPGFLQYLNHLQVPAAVTVQVIASEECMLQTSTNTNAGELSQGGQQVESVLYTSMRDNTSPPGQDETDSPQTIPLDISVTGAPHAFLTNPGVGYHSEVLSKPHNPIPTTTVPCITSNRGVYAKSKHVMHGSSGPDTARQRRGESSAGMISRGCQTEPLFEEIALLDGANCVVPDLPESLACVEKPDSLGRPSVGVVVTRALEAGEEFGPYTGDFVKERLGCCNPRTWEICVRGKTRFYINGATDPNNWMQHVQVARCKEEQNMEAFQFYGDIYFRTTKNVEAGSELKVFYSMNYSKRVGFKMGLEELPVDEDSQRFECQDCHCRYTNVKSLLRHLKFEHDKENNPVLGRSDKSGALGNREKLKVPTSGRISIDVKKKRVKQSSTGKRVKKPHKNVSGKKSRAIPLKVKLSPKKCSTETTNIPEQEGGEFSCKKCSKPFPSEGHLKEHAAFHRETKDLGHICDTCGLECKNARALQKHSLSHYPNAFQCPICHECFQRKHSIRCHLWNQHQKSTGEKFSLEELDELTRDLGYVCETCGLECKNSKVLQKHALTHDPNAFRCRICKVLFQRKKSARCHLRQRHQNILREKCTTDELDELIGRQREPDDQDIKVTAKSVCYVCGLECEDITSLKQHALSHNPNAYQCQHCDMRFEKKKRLYAHVQEDHEAIWWTKLIKGNMEEKLSRMIEPEEQSIQAEPIEPFHPDLPQDMLGKRILIQSNCPPKKFQCKYCPRKFCRYSGVRYHEKRKHLNSGPYFCEYCSASFETETQYVIHKRRHTKVLPFKCEECPRTFATESALKNHLPEHTGERPHKCDVCGKGHNTKKNMRKHRQRHTVPAVVFRCGFCTKTFRDRSSLKKHEDRHKGIRPFVCLTCGKAFKANVNLKSHVRIHTGEKPYECKVCGKRFRVEHFLGNHMVVHETNAKKT